MSELCICRDRILFSTLLTIKAMVRNNSIAIQRLSEQADKNLSQGEVEESIDNFGFPFKTIDQVRQVENILEDKTKFKLLVRHLTGLGGFTTKEVVDRMMSLVFTTSMARQFNWVGKAPKYGMKGMKITAAIKESGKCSRTTECELETAMRLWLKNAHDRDGGRKKRERDAEERKNIARARAILLDSSDSD
ncbi:uncharacterized protein LOC124285506 [Haliotis rubra]|uniref:uncharacterized protein LOC124285506 n=1 Tax=Haliotis rubra TaxID=36100 RepID=UPI001EE52485|nr:uncharacterized protein LOC124285506 [Haliotis rubra]